MRIRLGFFTGLLAGYYFGAKAGRQRYEQMNRLIKKARRSRAYDKAQDRAKAVADVAADRAKEAAAQAKHKVQDLRADHNNDQPNTFSPS